MESTNSQSLKIVSVSENKYKAYHTQLKTKFNYLKKHTAIASIVTSSIGIIQKCITRYKRDLEKAGRLAVVKKSVCKYSCHKAWCFTTNPEISTVDSITNFLKSRVENSTHRKETYYLTNNPNLFPNE